VADHLASAHATYSAPAERVWAALTEPDLIARYLFGTKVETTWEPGSPITWKGEYEGKSYEDKGEVLEVVPNERLKVTHFSPLTGAEDIPENYHTVLYEIARRSDTTDVTLTQEGSGAAEEAESSSKNWQMMLDGMRSVVE
jgi:uncharacterized protein YndB with AHSA1/START domain